MSPCLLPAALAGLFLVIVSGDAAVPAPAAGDSAASVTNLHTLYGLGAGERLIWTTCGTTAQGNGCLQSGALTGFDRPCAVLESATSTIGDTETSKLYVLDSGGYTPPGVVLKVFERTVQISGDTATTGFVLSQTLPLALHGGSKVVCYMVSTPTAILAATSLSVEPAQIDLSTYAVSGGGLYYGPPITGLTADEAGTFTTERASQYDGASFVPNQINGYLFQ